MDRAFDQKGQPVAPGSNGSYLVLSQENGRPVLKRDHGAGALEAISAYGFGATACYLLRSKFDWNPLLSLVPSPDSSEQMELKTALLARRKGVLDFYRDEIGPSILSDSDFDRLVEIYSRLFPAFGSFLDTQSFLSDNFYSFDPSWSFQHFQTAPTFRALVEEAFGVYRKDLARAVAGSTGSAICTISHFTPLLTVEQLVELLDGFDRDASYGFGYAGINFENTMERSSVLLRLSPRLRQILAGDFLRLAKDRDQDEFALLRLMGDTFTMLEAVAEEDLKRFRSDRSWDAVHNRAIGLAAAENIADPQEIDFPSKISELDGVAIGDGLRLKLLRQPLEFTLAGSSRGLNNCLGSAGYYTKALNGESYCLIAHRAGELEVALEIAMADEVGSWKIVQLNGENNRPLGNSAELRDEILLLLNGKVAQARRRAEPSTEDLEARIEQIQAHLRIH